MVRQSALRSRTESLSTCKAKAKLKISKCEKLVNCPVNLETKTCIEFNSPKFLQRSTLITIPPKDENAAFAVGDIFWAKQRDHPYWPCMVSKEPETGKYFHIDSKNKTFYYVQYFGIKPSHGWISTCIIPFEGFDKFKQKMEIKINEAKNEKTVNKVLKMCTASSSSKENWKVSIAEAHMAMQLSCEKRVQKLTFIYVPPENSKKLDTTVLKRKEVFSASDALCLKKNKPDNCFREQHEIEALPLPSPKTRMIEFQYKGELKRFPATFNFNIHFSSDSSAQSSEKGNLLKTSGPKNNKSKNSKNCLTKKTKAFSFVETPDFKTNSKQLQPKFCLPTDIKKYEEPEYSSQAYFRKNADKFPKETRQNVAEKDQTFAEYDMDIMDSLWLEEINKIRQAEQLLPVNENEFELTMEKLETEWYKQNQQKLIDSIENDDIVCSICHDDECQDFNSILICSMCNLAVHQKCYGIPYIPIDQWICRQCLQFPSRPVDCVLCPNKEGALKYIDDKRWAHVICALFIPKVYFGNILFFEPIDGIEEIPPEQFNLTCCICQKKEGACIQCNKSTCNSAFHVTCAKKAGFYTKIVLKTNPQGVSITKVTKRAYCINHKPKKSDDEKSDKKFKEDKTEKNESFQPTMNDEISLPAEVVRQISSTLDFPKRNEFLRRLYAYWMLKRRSRNGAPLMKPPQNSIRLDPLVLMKKKTRSKSEWDNLQDQLHVIKTTLENSRELLRQIIKREKLKSSIIETDMECHRLKIAPFSSLLNHILEQVTKENVKKFIPEPVDQTADNDNLNFINKPIDFEKIKKAVQFCKYTSIDAFKFDLQHIINNHKNYNEPDTIRHKTAIKLEKFIDKLFRKLKPQIKTFDKQTGTYFLLPSTETPSS